MNIAVDATCWANRRGYGRHARALVSELMRLDDQNEYTLVVDFPIDEEALPERAAVRRVGSERPAAEAASATGHRSLADMWRVSRALADRQYDLILFPTIYTFVPVFSRSRKVVFFHDVIAEKFSHLTHPQLLPRMLWRLKSRLGRWQADAVVTVSEHARRGIVERFRLPPEEVHVVGEASDPVFRQVESPRLCERLAARGYSAAKRSVIYVGGFSPHKNLLALIDVIAELCSDPAYADLQLVFVGATDDVFNSYLDEVVAHVAAQRLAERTIFTGFLTDEELVQLLNTTTVLALPSLLEGFGLPAVEAAACGCPVVATTESPLPSLLARGGLFAAPTDRAAWRANLAEVLSNSERRDELARGAVLDAQQLTWKAAAKELQSVIGGLA